MSGERIRCRHCSAGWTTEKSESDSWWGQEMMFPKTSRLILGSTQRPRHEADCCPPSGAEIKKRISGAIPLPRVPSWHVQGHLWFSLLEKDNLRTGKKLGLIIFAYFLQAFSVLRNEILDTVATDLTHCTCYLLLQLFECWDMSKICVSAVFVSKAGFIEWKNDYEQGPRNFPKM
jgi:hypothetical protein